MIHKTNMNVYVQFITEGIMYYGIWTEQTRTIEETETKNNRNIDET